jgi:hypothetical protein
MRFVCKKHDSHTLRQIFTDAETTEIISLDGHLLSLESSIFE